MSEPVEISAPPEKKRGRCCLYAILIPLVTVACLAGLVLAGPKLASWLGIFGMEAKEAYEAAPDLVASQSLTQTFSDLEIPGVKVYVIPIKNQPTQGAFIILDESAGYQGLDPLNTNSDVFLTILEDLAAKNRAEDLRLAHVTVDYRDEKGDTATAFTVDQDLIDQYVDGSISREEFFGNIEIDVMHTLQYLGIDGLLEEVQQ